MPKFWKFVPWLSSREIATALDACTIENSQEVFEAGFFGGQTIEEFPVAKLNWKIESVEVDCFSKGARTFVSKKIREIIISFCSEVQFFPIDSSSCSEFVQKMDFQILHVSSIHKRSSKGTSNSIPDRDMFFDMDNMGYTYVSDRLARCLVDRECSGVRLFHPDFSTPQKMLFLTREGIVEDIGWDDEKDCSITKLIK